PDQCHVASSDDATCCTWRPQHLQGGGPRSNRIRLTCQHHRRRDRTVGAVRVWPRICGNHALCPAPCTVAVAVCLASVCRCKSNCDGSSNVTRSDRRRRVALRDRAQSYIPAILRAKDIRSYTVVSGGCHGPWMLGGCQAH